MRGKRKKLVLGSKRSLDEGGAGRVWVRMEREVAGNEKEKEKAESEGRIPERPSRSGYANWGPFVPHVSTYKRTYAVTRTLLSYLCAQEARATQANACPNTWKREKYDEPRGATFAESFRRVRKTGWKTIKRRQGERATRNGEKRKRQRCNYYI